GWDHVRHWKTMWLASLSPDLQQLGQMGLSGGRSVLQIHRSIGDLSDVMQHYRLWSGTTEDRYRQLKFELAILPRSHQVSTTVLYSDGILVVKSEIISLLSLMI